MVERNVRVVPAERAGEFKLVCLDASPIDCLLHAKRIDRDTYEAAELYAEMWERSGLRPAMSASYDRQVDFGTPSLAVRGDVAAPASLVAAVGKGTTIHAISSSPASR